MRATYRGEEGRTTPRPFIFFSGRRQQGEVPLKNGTTRSWQKFERGQWPRAAAMSILFGLHRRAVDPGAAPSFVRLRPPKPRTSSGRLSGRRSWVTSNAQSQGYSSSSTTLVGRSFGALYCASG